MWGRISRSTYLSLGFLFVGLGIIGVFVPLMPTTIFLILAVGAFGKSDPALESKLLNHPRFGPTLLDWKEHKSIRLRTKWIAVGTIIPVFALSIFAIPLIWVQMMVGMIGLCLIAYICTRRTKVVYAHLAIAQASEGNHVEREMNELVH